MATATPTPKQLLQEFADEFIEKIFPQAIQAAESRLPIILQGFANLIVNPMLPGLEAAAEAYINAKIAAM